MFVATPAWDAIIKATILQTYPIIDHIPLVMALHVEGNDFEIYASNNRVYTLTVQRLGTTHGSRFAAEDRDLHR